MKGEESMKFFKVTTKCGHVGIHNYILIAFPVKAECGKDAAAIARYLPRVKHNRKDAIVSVEEISQQEFDELENELSKDPYLHCSNVQEQKLCEMEGRILPEERCLEHMKHRGPMKDVCNDWENAELSGSRGCRFYEDEDM